jgi:hypothetical protein
LGRHIPILGGWRLDSDPLSCLLAAPTGLRRVAAPPQCLDVMMSALCRSSAALRDLDHGKIGAKDEGSPL